MGKKPSRGDPRFMVEIGSERFDPKAEAATARRRTNAAKKKLARALGTEVSEIPGADREAWLVLFEDDPDAVRRFRDAYGLRLSEGISSKAFVERMDPQIAARVRRDAAVRSCIPYWPSLKHQTVDATADVSSLRFEVGLIEGDDVKALISILQTLGLNVLSINDDTKSGGVFSLLVEAEPGADFSAVAAVDDVAWIVRVGNLTIKNVDTAGVVQSGTAASHPVWGQGLHGEGMIIGVIDAGEIDLLSKFLRDSVSAAAAPGHRKVVAIRKAD